MKKNLGECSALCSRKATHVARHGAYRGLGLCAKHHEGPRPEPVTKRSPRSARPVKPATRFDNLDLD